MNAQDLKNSILQLAIQGKLVEQRKEEGTAKELLEKIEAEKKQLIKEGKIKKQKELPEIKEDEIPFDIPENWKWVRLGDVGPWGAGATPSRSNPKFYGGDIPWLKTGDLNDGYIREVPEFISEEALKKTSVKQNPTGSVLMAMYGATIGKLGILDIEATTNQACCACIPYSIIYNKYLFYYLMGQRRVYIKMGAGGAQPNISKDKIVNSLIPLPPLEEQKRIVAKIEELMPYVDKYDIAYSEVEELNKKFPEDMQKSILQYAIRGKLVEQREEDGTAEELYKQIQEEKKKLIKEGKIRNIETYSIITEDNIPFEIPESWKWVRLIDLLVEKPTNGFSPKGVDYETRIKNITLTATTSGVFKEAEYKYVDIEIDDNSSYWLKKNDLLIQRSNSRDYVGTSCVYTGVDNSFIYPDLIMRMRVHSELLVNYIDYALKAPYNRKYFRENASGTSESMPKINQGTVKESLIPLPPLAEQQRIVERIEELLPYTKQLVK